MMPTTLFAKYDESKKFKFKMLPVTQRDGLSFKINEIFKFIQVKSSLKFSNNNGCQWK